MLIKPRINGLVVSGAWASPPTVQGETPTTVIGEEQGGAVVVDKTESSSKHGVKVLSPEERQRREELLREIRKLYQGHPKSN